jgi:hypothetical protein
MTARALWKTAILAGLAAIAPLVLSMPARADIIITISEVGGPTAGPTTIAVGSPTANSGAGIASPSFTQQFGDFFITNGSAGESQTSTVSQAFTTALNITNNLGASARTLDILIQATGFTAPVPFAFVQSSFSGTATGGPNSGSLQSSVGAAEGQNSQGLQSVPLLDPSFNNTVLGTANGLAAPFSIFQRFRFTLAAGGQVNFTGRTILSAVPEPSVNVMLGVAGLLGLGFRTIRRKRSAV